MSYTDKFTAGFDWIIERMWYFEDLDEFALREYLEDIGYICDENSMDEFRDFFVDLKYDLIPPPTM